MTTHRLPSRRLPSLALHQRGVALAIVLILLLVMTLLGLAALRGTLLEERMSANQRDRSLSFQAAETALRAAEVVIQIAVGVVGFDCTTAASCPALPVNTYADSIDGCLFGNENCWQDVPVEAGQTLQAGRAQYYIQYLGQRANDTVSQSANCYQYSSAASCASSIEDVFRVTARNADASLLLKRSLVVLQTNVVRSR